MDMDISMDIHGKSVDMDMDMDGKFHIHGKPGSDTSLDWSHSSTNDGDVTAPTDGLWRTLGVVCALLQKFIVLVNGDNDAMLFSRTVDSLKNNFHSP